MYVRGWVRLLILAYLKYEDAVQAFDLCAKVGMKSIFLLLALWSTDDGDDSAIGTIEAPLATLPAVYKKVAAGNTVWFRGGSDNV